MPHRVPRSSYIVGAIYACLLSLMAIFMLCVPAIWPIASFLIAAIIFVSRFLSGFGLLGLIFMGMLLVFRYVPKDYRKKKSILTLVRILLGVSLLASVFLPLWALVHTFLGELNVSLLSMILGVLSFVVTMYLVPLWREKELPREEGILDSIRKAIGKISRKIKKGYYYYFSRDYLRAFSVDFIYLKTSIDSQRTKIGALLFPLVIIAMAYCPPALIIGIIYLLRLRSGKLSVIDNIVLSIALLVALTVPFTVIQIPEYLVLLWNVAYFLGSITAAVTFGPAVLDLILE